MSDWEYLTLLHTVSRGTDLEGHGHKCRSAMRLKPPDIGSGIKICAIAASIALFLNLILAGTAFGIGRSRAGSSGDDSFVTASLYEGKCSVTRNWSTGLHLLINSLGTAILSTSNYCAQFLAAPRREDVDRAHLRGSWLDIGVPSLRNIWAMGIKRKLIYLALFLTTIPVHAIYNSVILTSQSSNEYNIYIAPKDYDGRRTLALSGNSSSCLESQMHQSLSNFNSNMANASFDVLTKQECLDIYSQSYLTGRGNLVILSSDLTWDNEDTLISAGLGNAVDNYGPLDYPAPYGWMCPGNNYFNCTRSLVEKQLETWQVMGTPWSQISWGLRVPYINGRMESFKFNHFPACPSRNADDPLCMDLHNLSDRVWFGVPLSQQGIEDYLDNPDNWENSTWAKAIQPYVDQTICNKMEYMSFLSNTDKLYQVDSCLSVTIEERCHLLFSPLFAVVVIICTLLKVLCILYVTYYERSSRLLTVGDAIASFLSLPDQVTKGRCLASRSDWKQTLSPWNGVSRHMIPRKLRAKPARWWEAGSILQWGFTLATGTGCILAAGLLLNRGLNNRKLAKSTGLDFSALWNLGLGNMNATTIIFRIDTTLLGNVLVANVPQIAVSISYYYYNAILTTMLMSSEYDGYAIPRACHTITAHKAHFVPKKGLRVSGKPQGLQRSTYFLSLPYRYSVPLLVSYATLHWLVSQSIFYVKVIMYDSAQNRVPSADVDACGWSPMALILSITVGGLMVLALMALGLRKFQSSIPLAGSCSAAISAACHRPRDDSDAALEAVMWGELPSDDPFMGGVNLGKQDTMGDVRRVDSDSDYQRGCFSHCCFTSYDVMQPSPGQIYV